MAIDTSRKILVLCLGFELYPYDPQMAVLARQLAETFATLLRVLPNRLTLPQYVKFSPERESSGPWIKPVFKQLVQWPPIQTARALASDFDAREALVGEIQLDGLDLSMAASLVKVHPFAIEATAQARGRRTDLLTLVKTLSTSLLQKVSEEDEVWKKGSKGFRERVGTESFRAYVNWAQARELERRGQRDRPFIHRLLYALEADPHFKAPVRSLYRLLSSRADLLETLAKGLDRIQIRQIALGLIRAQAWRRLGEWERAIEALKQTIAAFPHKAEPHYLLGQIYEQMGREKEAKMQYRQASILNPNNEVYAQKSKF